MMKKWSIRGKLLYAFSIVTLLTIIIGSFGIRGLNTLNMNEQVIFEIAKSTNASQEMAKNIEKQYSAIQDAVIHHYTGLDYNPILSQLTEMNSEFSILLESQEKSIPPEEKIAIDLIAATKNIYLNDYIPTQNLLMSAITSGDNALIAELFTKLDNSYEEVYNNMNAFVEAGLQLIDVTKTMDGKTASLIITLMFILLAVTIFISILFAVKSSGLISVRAKFMRDLLSKMGKMGVVSLTDEELRQAENFNAKEQDEIGESIDMLIATGKRIEAVGKLIETVANGDLTSEVKILSPDDTLGVNLQKMLYSLNDILGSVNESSSQVAYGAKQMADSSQTLAQSATEQSASVQQLSGSVSEMLQKTKDSTRLAQDAAHLAGTIKKNAEKGNEQMDNMMDAVRDIGEASQSIGKVIKVIDDIAFQTNILALNAAVEAARAGAYGKGFAVVAEEVRNLAAKSAEAAKDTGSLISNSIEKASLGTQIAGETAASLRDIVSGINESALLVDEIARYSGEQADSIALLNDGIELVSQVIQQNSATAEESSAASEEMNNQADLLKQLIARFKVSNVDF